MWLLLLLFLSISGALTSVCVVCACVIAGRIDRDQTRAAPDAPCSGFEDATDALPSGGLPVSHPQWLFN